MAMRQFMNFWLLLLLTTLNAASCHKLSLLSRRDQRLLRDEPAGVQLPVKRTTEGWYTVEVQLANSSIHLLVDTGSSALWARIPTSSETGARGRNASLGSFTAQYGRGAVSGVVVDTPLLLPGAAKSRTCHVGVPTDEGPFWAKQRSIDGVLGLGCSGEDATVDALACVVPKLPQRPLLLGPHQDRVFCLELTPNGGLLTLGSVPQSVQLNLIAMPPVSDCGHWTVPLLSLSVQSTDGAGAKNIVHAAEAVLDSGSNGVIGPTFAVIELARRLGASPGKPGEGYGGEVTFYEVPCDAAMNLPSVTLVLGDADRGSASITLKGPDLVSPGEDGQENCHLRLAGWETQSWILGSVFLTHLQAIAFDVDSGVVAIAPHAQVAD